MTKPELHTRCDESGDPAVHASHLPGDGAPGRRDRPGAVAGDPSPGRGAADPARIPPGRLSAREPTGRAARRLRRGGRDDHGDPGRAQAPDDDGRGEPERDPAAPARPLGHSPAGLHDSRRADQLSPRARPGHRADRHRRDLRRPRPDDRRGRCGQPADRRAPAGPRGGRATRSTWRGRPARGSPARRSTRSRRRPTASSSRLRRRSPASSPRCRTRSSSSTPCSARSS